MLDVWASCSCEIVLLRVGRMVYLCRRLLLWQKKKIIIIYLYIIQIYYNNNGEKKIEKSWGFNDTGHILQCYNRRRDPCLRFTNTGETLSINRPTSCSGNRRTVGRGVHYCPNVTYGLRLSDDWDINNITIVKYVYVYMSMYRT